jgi:hypothetical protein
MSENTTQPLEVKLSENIKPEKKWYIQKKFIIPFIILTILFTIIGSVINLNNQIYNDRQELIAKVTKGIKLSTTLDELKKSREAVDNISTKEVDEEYNQRLYNLQIAGSNDLLDIKQIKKYLLNSDNLQAYNKKLTQYETEEVAKELEKKKLEEMIKNPTAMPEYKVIKRDYDDLKGKAYKVTGKIVQLQLEKYDPKSDLYSGMIRLSLSNDKYFDDDMIYLTYFGLKPDIFEKDTKEFVLIGSGLYTYETTMGGKITLPSFKIAKITGQDIKILPI